jgi:TetR/AcrR family transcriptional regulator, transcriptional repressor for nem operon
MSNHTDTREQLMAAGRKMVQARGYNALSFRDLAEMVGVKSASVHYHFPTKGDLGAALARRYTEDGMAYLDAMLADGIGYRACLDRYVALFRTALEDDNRMCLCGIMAAEAEDLPEAVRAEVAAFTNANVAWLTQLLAERRPGTDAALARDRGAAIYAAVAGAQLVARGRRDLAVYDAIMSAFASTGLFD